MISSMYEYVHVTIKAVNGMSRDTEGSSDIEQNRCDDRVDGMKGSGKMLISREEPYLHDIPFIDFNVYCQSVTL